MISPAALLAALIRAKTGKDVTIGKEVEGGADVTVYDTGGRDPATALSTDCKPLMRPGVQVRVRGTSYPVVYASIHEIRKAITGALEYNHAGWRLMRADQTSDVISLGEDASNRSIMTVNFILTLQEE